VPLAEREEQLEGEIAGDAEDLANADFLQIGDQKIAERHVPLHAHLLSSPRSADLYQVYAKPRRESGDFIADG